MVYSTIPNFALIGAYSCRAGKNANCDYILNFGGSYQILWPIVANIGMWE